MCLIQINLDPDLESVRERLRYRCPTYWRSSPCKGVDLENESFYIIWTVTTVKISIFHFGQMTLLNCFFSSSWNQNMVLEVQSDRVIRWFRNHSVFNEDISNKLVISYSSRFLFKIYLEFWEKYIHLPILLNVVETSVLFVSAFEWNRTQSSVSKWTLPNLQSPFNSLMSDWTTLH